MSRKNVVEKKIIIALIILAGLQIINLIVFQVLLHNGYIAVKMIETNRYDSAIKIIRKCNISDNPSLQTQMEKDMQHTLTEYIDEKISYEDAYSMIHRYDNLTNLNYDFSNSETLRLFNEIHISKENMNKADELRKIDENKAINLAKAINYYNTVSPGDTPHYSKLSEQKDITMKELNSYIDAVYSDDSISDVFIEIENFLETCEDESCSKQCSELRESYLLRSKTDLDDYLSSKNSKKFTYKSTIDTIEQYQNLYSSNKELYDEVTQLKSEYIIKYIDNNISGSTYSKDEAFEVAEKYASEYPDLDLIDYVCGQFRKSLNKKITNKKYHYAEQMLKNNKTKVTAYKSELGFTYKSKLLSVYKKWCSSKIESHEYLVADDGHSAMYLAKKANELSKGSISITEIVSEAQLYEENQLVQGINEKRISNAIPKITRYSLIDDICSELVLQLMDGEKEFDDFWDVANRHNIKSLYSGSHSAYLSWNDDSISAENFLSRMSDKAGCICESSQYSKIGVATVYNSSEQSFYWVICVFT